MKTTIGGRLGITFSALVLILTIPGFVSISRLRVIEDCVSDITEIHVPIDDAASELEINLIGTGFALLGYLHDHDPTHLERLKDDEQDFERFQAIHHRLAVSDQARALGRQVDEDYDRFKAIADNLLEMETSQCAGIQAFNRHLSEIESILNQAIHGSVGVSDPHAMEKSRVAMDMEISSNRLARLLASYLRTHDTRIWERIVEHEAKFNRSLAEYQQMPLSGEESRWRSEMAGHFKAAMTLAREIDQLDVTKESRLAAFVALRRDLDSLLDEEIQRLSADELAASKQAAVAANEFTRRTVQGAIVAAVVIALVIGVLSARSITLRVRALQDAKDYTESIIGSMADLLVVVTPDGTIVTTNRAACDLLGYSMCELLGAPASLLFEKGPPRDPGSAIMPPILQRLLEGDLAGSFEDRILTKSGEAIPVLLSGAAIRGRDGKIHGTVCVGQDISERKRAEADLAAAKTAADAACRAKSDFLANMSHEIRTPMTAILGFADTLAESHQSAEQMNAVDTIRQNGSHLLEIINGILNLAQIDSGTFVVEQVACNLRRLVDGVMTLMRVRSDKKGISLTLQWDNNCPDSILTDPLRLRQILINLLGNAIKFTESGGVRVIVRPIENNTETQRLSFQVVDTGIGMTAEQIEHIFQPFCQADTTASRRFGGTGLGLTISKRLVAMLGGSISVQSDPGEGSTFAFTIVCDPLEKNAAGDCRDEDCADRKSHPENPSARDSQPLAGYRLLVAEDSPDIQRLLGVILRKAGAEVTLAENGQIGCDKALAAQAQGNTFDAIVTDMQMPVLNGYEAARRLRQAGYDDTIIAITAHAMADDPQKCLDAGCDGYLAKPIDRHQLIELIIACTQPRDHHLQPVTAARGSIRATRRRR